MSNAILEQIHQVLGNLVRIFNIQQNCVDKNYPWTGILAAAAFEICSTTSRQKGYGPGQLIFGRDMILPKKHSVDWKFIRKIKQTQINIDNNRENKHRFDYYYKMGYEVMITYHTSYKYETPYKGPFLITQFFTNGTVNLQYGPTKSRHNIRNINPYTLDTIVED